MLKHQPRVSEAALEAARRARWGAHGGVLGRSPTFTRGTVSHPGPAQTDKRSLSRLGLSKGQTDYKTLVTTAAGMGEFPVSQD